MQYASKADVGALWEKVKADFTHTLAFVDTNLKLTRQLHTGSSLEPSGNPINCGTIAVSDFRNWLGLGSLAYKSSLVISDITGLETALGNKVETSLLGKTTDTGVATLSSGKIPLSQIPDAILGQLVYGGNVTGTLEPSSGTKWVQLTISTNAKAILQQRLPNLNFNTNNIYLTTSDTSGTYGQGQIPVVSYTDAEGIYAIIAEGAVSQGVLEWAGESFEVGDWLICNGTGWSKIDNTDAVTSVNGQIGAVTIALNTTGANQSTSKLFLVGTTEQTTGTNGLQTYSNSKVYISGSHLYSNNIQVVNLSGSQSLTNKTYNGLVLTAADTGFTIAGGTTSKTLTVGDSYSLGPACEKNFSDSSSASAISSTDENLVTARDVYYGLPTINNSHAYTSSTKIYAPSGGGTAGQYLKAVGSTTKPTWETFAVPVVAWTNGTTSGPTLTVTTDGGTSTAQAIPSAGSGQSGVVTTDTQTFAGSKTFNDQVVIANNTAIACKKSGGAVRNVLRINSEDEFYIGPTETNDSTRLRMYGQDIRFYVRPSSVSNVLMGTINGDGFMSERGVAAKGIADLAVSGGGGGVGTVTGIRMGASTQTVIGPESGTTVIIVPEGSLQMLSAASPSSSNYVWSPSVLSSWLLSTALLRSDVELQVSGSSGSESFTLSVLNESVSVGPIGSTYINALS